jgi:hypothetical protein
MGTVSSGELASESTENILERTHIRRLLAIPPHIPSAYVHIDVNYCQQKVLLRKRREHSKNTHLVPQNRLLLLLFYRIYPPRIINKQIA